MFKKILIILGSTLLLAALLFIGVKFYTKYTIGFTKVYVASHQISQRSLMNMDDLIETEVPKDYLTEDVYVDLDDILNKYVKLSCTIPKGSLIYKGSLESDIGDLANTLLKNGEVNYDIYTKNVRINTANLQKNVYIDLYLTINNKDKPISDLLISNARITGLYDTNDKLILDYDKDSRVAIISIAIDKEYVSILNKAQVLGEISCVINNNAYDMNQTSYIDEQSKLFEYFE